VYVIGFVKDGKWFFVISGECGYPYVFSDFEGHQLDDCFISQERAQEYIKKIIKFEWGEDIGVPADQIPYRLKIYRVTLSLEEV